jgi:hypothetical protein
LWMKQERDCRRKKSQLTGEASSAVEKHSSVVEKHVSSSIQKSLMISEPVNKIPLIKLNLSGSHISPSLCTLKVSLYFLSFRYFKLYIFRSF